MRLFAHLYDRLDATTRTSRKVAALVEYFRQAPGQDAAWAVHFLIGRRPQRLVATRRLRQWAAELAGIPDWLFEAAYENVGDLAETITLLLPARATADRRPLHEWVENYLLPLGGLSEAEQQRAVIAAWNALDPAQRFVWNKLITGGFRVGVARKLVVRALAESSGLDAYAIAHRLMGRWQPSAAFFEGLLAADTTDTDISRPYPFYLAYPLAGNAAGLGTVTDWQAEWKWDGIRAQVIHRRGEVFIWTRGEALVTERYPEIAAAAAHLPDGTVIDGELLGWGDGRPLDFGVLQKRVGRKTVSPKVLAEVPVRMMVYDQLEGDGGDMRQLPLKQRKAALMRLVEAVGGPTLMNSPLLDADAWSDLVAARSLARDRGVEGIMLKRRNSPYGIGRQKGDWWKWKVDPYRVDAVLLYAQQGHGRRSGLFTDYTLAVWDGDRLVPFAKAYSGLSDSEIRQVDRFVRRRTTDRFGPVRAVQPELVFEVAFEGIHRSNRHKSGVAVRFPRIARWRTDKRSADADTLETVRALLPEGS